MYAVAYLEGEKGAISPGSTFLGAAYLTGDFK